MAEAVLIDTWGWLALGHCRDHRHQEVKVFHEILKAQGIRLYTTDYALDEVLTLVFRREVFEEAVRLREGLFEAGQQGRLTIDRTTSERFASAQELRKRFQDKPTLSFTNLTSMAIMRDRAIKQVLTDDDHFLHVGMEFQKVP